MRRPFPLQWPQGWPRTPADERTRSRFGTWRRVKDKFGPGTIGGGVGIVSLVDACREIVDEIRKLGSQNLVITSDLPTKANDMPMATAQAQTPDPGIAVWWVDPAGHEKVIACDQFLSHAENARAIARTIAAMRGIERWGSTAIVERAWAGFTALPSGDPRDRAAESTPGPSSVRPPFPPEPSREWMEYFHVQEAASREVVKKMYRMFAKELHPDKNRGDHALMAQLNAAWSGAEAWFAWRDLVTGRAAEPEDGVQA